MEEAVKKYLGRLEPNERAICRKLRRLVLKTFPKIEERYKLGCLWYGKFYIVGLKGSVNLGFSVKGLTKAEAANFKGSGKLMKHLKFREKKEIDEKRVVGLLRLVDEKCYCPDCCG